MKLTLPAGWSVSSTMLWTFLVVVSAKLSLWAVDSLLAPMLARAVASAG